MIHPKTSRYTVKRGDSLWKIAEEQYGDGSLWTEIGTANRLQNPPTIFAGTKLNLPTVTGYHGSAIGSNAGAGRPRSMRGLPKPVAPAKLPGVDLPAMQEAALVRFPPGQYIFGTDLKEFEIGRPPCFKAKVKYTGELTLQRRGFVDGDFGMKVSGRKLTPEFSAEYSKELDLLLTPTAEISAGPEGVVKISCGLSSRGVHGSFTSTKVSANSDGSFTYAYSASRVSDGDEKYAYVGNVGFEVTIGPSWFNCLRQQAQHVHQPQKVTVMELGATVVLLGLAVALSEVEVPIAIGAGVLRAGEVAWSWAQGALKIGSLALAH